jgi:hypothetical protein
VAVYRSEIEKLAAAERTLSDTVPPVEALRAWLLLFVAAVETKHIIAPVLNTLVGDPKKVFEAFHGQIHEALRALVKGATKSGNICKDLPDRSASRSGRRRQCRDPRLKRAQSRRHSHRGCAAAEMTSGVAG